MIDHQLCREYGALAASGQLESEELEILLEHCRTCAECRQEIASFTQVSARLFIAPQMRIASSGERLDRFKARILREGLTLGDGAILTWRPLLGAALLIFAVTFTTFLELTRASSARFAQSAGPQMAQEKDQRNSTAPPNFAAHDRVRTPVKTSYRHDPRWSPGLRKTVLRSKSLSRSSASDRALDEGTPAQSLFNFPKILTTEVQADDFVPNRAGTEDGSFLSVRLPGSHHFRPTVPVQIDPTMAVPSVSIAEIGRLSELDFSSRHYDLSANIRLLRFQIPTVQ